MRSSFISTYLVTKRLGPSLCYKVPLHESIFIQQNSIPNNTPIYMTSYSDTLKIDL